MAGYTGVLEIEEEGLNLLLDPETLEDKELPILEQDYCHATRLGDSLTLARCDEDDKWFAVRVGTKEERKVGQYPAFLDDICYWSEHHRKSLTIIRDGKKIGTRPDADYASFFTFRGVLFDFSSYGVYETLANRQILNSPVNDVVPVTNSLYIAKENRIFLRPYLLASGTMLNLPPFDKTLEPYNLCPFGQTLYFKSGLDLYELGESPSGRSGVGQFKYYFPEKSLEVLLDTEKWVPWQKDEFGCYPIDFEESESLWVPITARELDQLKLLEYKRPK